MKKRETILFGRLGNKDNDIKFFKSLLPLDCKNVVEPFGGSFSVIRNIYNDDKYDKYVNDTDSNLKYIYQEPEEYFKFKYELNEIAKKYIYDDKKMCVDRKKFCEEIEEKKLNENKFYKFWLSAQMIRGIVMKYTKNINCENMLNICKKINFTFDDWKICIEKHRINEDTFIFLDPPYLFSDNSSYTEQENNPDMTDILYLILEIFKDKTTKAKIMLIINDLKIIRWIYKDYLKFDYSRIYQLSNRKNKHLVITNY